MEAYAGRSARTRQEAVVYRCTCGEPFAAQVWLVIEAEQAELVERLRAGTLNEIHCPRCEARSTVAVPVLLHDREGRRLVLVLPDSLRHRELQERASLLRRIAEDATPTPDYVLDAEVVFGGAALVTRTEAAQAARAPAQVAARAPAQVAARAPAQAVAEVSTAPAERPERTVKTERPERTLRTEQPERSVKTEQPERTVKTEQPERTVKTEQPERTLRTEQPERTAPPEAEAEDHARVIELEAASEADADDTDPGMAAPPIERRGRPRAPEHPGEQKSVVVPDPRGAVIERWIAGREGPAAFLVEDQVLVLAALPASSLEWFLGGELELRVQLHRLPNYPLLALTLIGGLPGARSDEPRVLSIPLDVARAAHRVLLETMGRQAVLTLELYDAQYLPVISHRAAAPVEDNIGYLVGEAKGALQRLAPTTRSFERARVAFQAPGYDRLGRTPIDLPGQDVAGLGPAAVRAAVAQVARWSEPAAEAYLIEIRSLSLAGWRSTRARVIRKALDTGIAVPRTLAERAFKELGKTLPPWPEVVALQVRRFSEIAARLKPNDLSPSEEADNWDKLLHDCAQHGVVVEEQVRRLAAAGREIAVPQEEIPDLAALPTEDLIALLDRRDSRREAAVLLCSRREAPTLPAVFAALRRMPRGEANVVLPAITGFGPACEKWLIEGLRSKKSFMRQGCALGLGVLKTPLAVDALVRMVLEEPTEIWGEVARALGDAGAQAVMPVAARLREVDQEGRERLVTAMAHVAARGPRGPIEMLAAGRDQLVAQVAQRALALSGEVRAADEAVRQPGGEQTVVRGFTRRFYEALGGEVELDPADLEELDEEEEDTSELSMDAAGLSSLGGGPDATIPTPRRGLPDRG